MLRVGLTGGIASGKTRVRARLAEAGLPTFDLDHVAHDVVEPGRPAHAEIVRLFGPTVLAPDGRVDRRVLGGIVFADRAALADLNAIVHPRVFQEHDRLVAGLPPGSKAVVTDATLLVESGYHIRFDRLVATSCRVEQQIERLTGRDGLSEADARARIAAQMPAAEKAMFAHRVVDTSDTEAETDRGARALAGELAALADSWAGPAGLDLSRVVGCLAGGPAQGPRGLSPLGLARSIAEHGAPSGPALARRLSPPWIGPWYEAGRVGTAAGPGPETLMGPVVLWARAWYGADVESLLAAAVSVARLSHVRGEALASAAAMAVALHEVAETGVVPGDLAGRVRAREAAIVRWAGSPAPVAFLERLEPGGRESSGLGGALQGLAAGRDPATVPAELLSAAQGLVLASSRRPS